MNNERKKRRIRGFQKERDLVRKLWSMGFATMRAPASGAKARKTYQPDIIAVRNGYVFVIEVKTRRTSRVIYVENYQVEKIREWVKRAGEKAYGMIAAYIGRDLGWRFIPIEQAEVTKSGNLKLDEEKIRRGLTILQLKLLSEKNVNRIDTFFENKHTPS